MCHKLYFVQQDSESHCFTPYFLPKKQENEEDCIYSYVNIMKLKLKKPGIIKFYFLINFLSKKIKYFKFKIKYQNT